MDAIADPILMDGDRPLIEDFVGGLRRIESVCAWADGWWQFGKDDRRRWNDLQNTSRDMQLLANHLLANYRPGTLQPAS